MQWESKVRIKFRNFAGDCWKVQATWTPERTARTRLKVWKSELRMPAVRQSMTIVAIRMMETGLNDLGSPIRNFSRDSILVKDGSSKLSSSSLDVALQYYEKCPSMSP